MQALLLCDVHSPNVYFTFMVPKLIPLGCKNLSLVSYSANVQADYDPLSY